MHIHTVGDAMTLTITRETIDERVREALVEFGLEAEDVQPDSTLATLEFDSLDLVELGQIIKEEFKIELEPEDAVGVETYGQVVDLIYSKVQG
jgi:acyl carrier protein